MKSAIRTVLTASILLGMAGAARPDVITDWNEAAVDAGVSVTQPTFVHTRTVAMVHVAMFDALNSIERRYTPYRVQLQVPGNTSREAAAAASAHYLLVRHYPGQSKKFDAALQNVLGKINDETAKAEGIRLGERVAEAILADRKADGSSAPNTYRPYTTAGMYVPTVFPVASSWGSVMPFGLQAGNQFRPAAPYALTSAQWARDFNEVKQMGAKTGSGRSAEQTNIALFWQLTGAPTYNPLVRHIASTKNLDLLDSARVFALTAIAAADAYIAIFDAKYTYNFWRPVTAIRNADIDGNDATERDAAWESTIPTPMHPEYPCAHCIVQSSVATVMSALFGDAVPTVQLTSTTAPGVTRTFNRLSDYVTEVVNARVYDGVHYRMSGEVGAAMGRGIGDHVVKNYFRPAR